MPADQRPGDPFARPTAGTVATGSLQRRSAARTAVVWDALRAVLDLQEPGRPASVVDIGGGTGGFAVRAAELGHRVVVIDPSPDALATLARRAEESGVADRVTGHQGDLDSLDSIIDLVHRVSEGTGTGTGSGIGSGQGADVVLCHGVLEIVEDPATALAALARVLRPGGTLSLLVNQRHAAVVARAMAGHFQQARTLLDPAQLPLRSASDGPDPRTGEPSGLGQRRFTAEEIREALIQAGLDIQAMHAVRVFVDLVPSSTVDLEPGAVQALVELERAVATRPEYLLLGTQIHTLATRR
jgi:S-adenosylmethionine-dependent methyltransferase